MRFAIDYSAALGDAVLASSDLLASLEKHREALTDISSIEGSLVLTINDEPAPCEHVDPLLRLANGWLRKVPWVIAGDTETVALRNSELCFAFVPTGEAVELSFFQGDEAEIEEYVLEPTHIRLEDFVTASIALGERIVALITAIDPELLESNEDCKDLVSSLAEASRAWHDHEIRGRR